MKTTIGPNVPLTDEQILAEYKNSHQNWEFGEAKPLWALPPAYSEDSSVLTYVLDYEKKCFEYQKLVLKLKYHDLPAALKEAYPLFESLKEFHESEDIKSGFVVAKILSVKKYKKEFLEIYDGAINTCYTYESLQQLKENLKNEKDLEIILDELLLLYKKDYADALMSKKPYWPFLNEDANCTSFEDYVKIRYQVSKKLLKSELTYGFFLQKKKIAAPKSLTCNLNELQKTVSLTSKTDNLEVMYTLCPNRNLKQNLLPGENKNKILFCSDIHVGSYTCCTEDIENLVLKVNQDEDIKYMVLTGDLIDGIDVYPNQKRDLKIKDYVAQYTLLARFLNKIRKDVRFIICPGNHDFLSKVQPQYWPAEVKEIFLEVLVDRKILFVSNPCYLEIEGKKVYLSHGIGLCYISNAIGEFDLKKPIQILNLLTDQLHVCAIQGAAPIRATNPNLYHMIPEDTNIINIGHIHRQQSFYRTPSCLLLSNGTFQNITPYMGLMGLEPTVSSVWVVKLGTLEAESLDCATAFTKDHTYKAVEAQIKYQAETEK